VTPGDPSKFPRVLGGVLTRVTLGDPGANLSRSSGEVWPTADLWCIGVTVYARRKTR